MVDPLSYFSFQPVLHDWCTKGCSMYYPVCGMMHIKEPLLLIGMSIPCSSFNCNLTLYTFKTVSRKEGNVLFNDALNTFYLRLYGVRLSILIVRKETRCRHMGYSFRLTARVLLYAPSHRQDSTYHGICDTSRRVLAGTRNSSMGSPHEGSIRRPIAPWANALTTELHLAPYSFKFAWILKFYNK